LSEQKSPDEFAELLRRLVNVPKSEIDEQELEYQDAKPEVKQWK